MSEFTTRLNCGFCDLNHDPGETHCLSCGGQLDKSTQHCDSEDILLIVHTHLKKVIAKKTELIFGRSDSAALNVAAGAVCTIWMCACFVIASMSMMDADGSGAASSLAAQQVEQSNDVVAEPTLQAANGK